VSAEQPSIEELVEASSLGTPDARAARDSVPSALAAAIVARSKVIGREDEQRVKRERIIREAVLAGDRPVVDTQRAASDAPIIARLQPWSDPDADPIADMRESAEQSRRAPYPTEHP
jgi:hypothetical protein